MAVAEHPHPAIVRRTASRSGVALLLALFTLLCAICPLGLPSSQKLGSAFNPANEVVTVRPEAKLLAVRAAGEAPDPRGPVPVALVATRLVAAPAVAPDLSDILAVALAPLPALSSFAARAPPARA